MANDMFLQVDGIEGESTDKGHTNWIDVYSFSHGASQNVQMGRGTDVAGRGIFEAFTMVHAVDKATPKIQQFCMNGQKISKAKLDVCRAIAGRQEIVYEVTLENVKIASATVKLIKINDIEQPVEEVEFIAGKISWKVTSIKPDNTKDGAIEACFDQISNS